MSGTIPTSHALQLSLSICLDMAQLSIRIHAAV